MTRALCLFLCACTASKGVPEPPSGLTAAEAATAVQQSRYEADLAITAIERSPGSAGWTTVQDHCADVLEDAGFTVTRDTYDSGVNVIGRLEGVGEDRSTLVLGAHYDHISGCTGADDNATGVAGVLEAARVLATGRWTHDLVVACWDEEERGLIGSDHHAEQEIARGQALLGAVSFEMIGYTSDVEDSQSLPAGFDLLFPEVDAELTARGWRGDFIGAISDAGMDPFVTGMTTHAPDGLDVVRVDLAPSQINSPLLADLQRSDHASFWRREVPALQLTDTAEFRYANYHCTSGPDEIANLDPVFASGVVAAAVGGAAEMLITAP